ncbi:MAG: hypothetical protein WCK14_00450 [Actinomycetota bacterium]|jgi:hypothetical protein
MSVRKVLLSGELITAIANPSHADHPQSAVLYTTLLQGYVAGADRLYALSTDLARFDKTTRRAAFAAVETAHVARQHQSAARKVDQSHSPETALALVIIAAEKITAVATLGDQFDPFDLEIIKPLQSQ